MRSRTSRCRGWTTVGLLLLVSVVSGCGSGGDTADYDAAVVGANNRGVALMGRFDFESARQVFEGLVGDHPDDPRLRINLAIAILNRQEEGDEAAAKEIVGGVLTSHPENLDARYVRGLLSLHMGESQAAHDDFLVVVEADPQDADAAYHLGQSLMQLEDYEGALQWFQRAIEEDRMLRSAHYRAFQALQRLGRAQEAAPYIESFQRLDGNPMSRLMEFKYTKMGRRAEASVLGGSVTFPEPRPEGEVFAAAVSLAEGDWRVADSVLERSPNITGCDVDGDGGLDLFLAGASIGDPAGSNTVLRGAGGDFTPMTDHPLAAVAGVNAALWGDLDNDGRNDVYLCRRGPNQLWLQREAGAWTEAAAASGVDGGDLDTVDGALYDADHDGDLDIFLVNADGDNELFNNNRDGSFRPLAAEAGLGGVGRSRSVVVSDLDGDLVADVMVVNRQPPHEVYLNRLLWDYQPASGFDAFSAAGVAAVVAGDVDSNGRAELYSLGDDATVNRWVEGDSGGWTATPVASLSGIDDPDPRLELADIDGDGTLDLLVSARSGWRLLSAVDGKVMAEGDDAVSGAGLFALDPRRGPSLVGWSDDGPVGLDPGPGRFEFVAMKLSGLDDDAMSLRSNASGVGARVAMRVGNRWTVIDGYRASSGPGQSLQPLVVGLGGAALVDFVTVDWSDAVFQTEMALGPGEIHEIVETQRQLSSCPVLFAWNGRTFGFVSDFLGVGGMGYAVGPGEYSEPRPWENLLLPDGAVTPRDGRILFKLTEPMEEAAYFDAARLVAYDVPPGWAMSVDERMAILGPHPTGRTFLYRQTALPARAFNERGEDVTEAVVEADLRAAPVGEIDRRFIGRLSGEHILTLEFDKAVNWLGRRLALVADGWVEYPYSSTSFAAWQAGAEYLAPTLEARGADGRWTVVLEQFGYPAGMPRQMSVPLPRLPAGTTALRLRSNMEVYWDRIMVVGVEVNEEIVRRELDLLSARVEQVGFALRTTGSERLPHYDHEHRVPLWDTRVQPGLYSEFGEATELMAAADDALAIIGPGEGVHLEFGAPTEDPAQGWTRVYVLEAEGWCKDMDLYTKDGATLGPIPAAGRASSATALLQESHNTRWNGS